MIVPKLVAGLVALAPLVVAAQPTWPIASEVIDIAATGPGGEIHLESPMRSLRLDNGTIAVADLGARKVVFFNARGTVLRSAGQTGAGPGEWRSVVWIGQCAQDSVFAFDPSQLRMTVLSAGGDVVRQFAFPDSGGAPDMLQMSCSRTGAIAYFKGTGRGGTPPVMEMSGDLVLHTGVGKPVQRMRGISMGEVAVLGGGSMPRPLGPMSSLAVSGDRVHVGVGDSARLLAFAVGTGQRTSVPLTLEKRAPSRALHDASIQRSLAMVPLSARGRASQMAATLPLREQMPAHGDIFADGTGMLWVVTTFAGDPTTRLVAIDHGGRSVATLALPKNIAVHEVGRDHVIGLYYDDDELPHIVVYRFRRN